MLDNMKIVSKIMLIVVLFGIFMCVSTIVSIMTAKNIDNRYSEVIDTLGNAAIYAVSLENADNQVGASFYRLISATQEADIKEANAAIDQWNNEFFAITGRLSALSRPSSDYTQFIADVSALSKRKFEIVNSVRKMDRDKRTEEFIASSKKSYSDLSEKISKLNGDLGERVASSLNESNVSITSQTDNAIYMSIFISGIAIVLGVLASFYIAGKGVATPIGRLTSQMGTLADGQTNFVTEGVRRGDEVGRMAQALEVFRERKVESDQLAIERQAEQEQRAQRAHYIEELARSFDRDISSSLKEVGSAVENLTHTSGEMNLSLSESVSMASQVNAAADIASSNVQTVAAAAEELAVSVREIQSQVTSAAEVSGQASHQAEKSSAIVQGLSETAQKIGDIVSMINDIASQTNLLALNATIEAARAGDAGKGFAVVASEVKNLANQTSRATEEIGAQITSIQNVTHSAAEAMEAIVQTINHLRDGTTTIASAVEEQGAATREIARSVQEASSGTMQVSDGIAAVSTMSDRAGEGASHVAAVITQLDSQARLMRQRVEEFLNAIRAV